jgi:hypothetical protein
MIMALLLWPAFFPDEQTASASSEINGYEEKLSADEKKRYRKTFPSALLPIGILRILSS